MGSARDASFDGQGPCFQSSSRGLTRICCTATAVRAMGGGAKGLPARAQRVGARAGGVVHLPGDLAQVRGDGDAAPLHRARAQRVGPRRQPAAARGPALVRGPGPAALLCFVEITALCTGPSMQTLIQTHTAWMHGAQRRACCFTCTGRRHNAASVLVRSAMLQSCNKPSAG